MTPSNPLLPHLISFLVLVLVLILVKVESQDTSFSINAFTPHSQLLTYELDAAVPPDETYVRLTNAVDGQNSVGRVLYTSPVKFWENGKQASFETTITLQITRTTSTGGTNGMAFFVIPVNSTLTTGGKGQNIGIYDALIPGSPLLAVEFDTYLLTNLDPKYRHIGININSARSQTYAKFEDPYEQLVTARITYDAPKRNISVVVTYGSKTMSTSFVFNLKAIFPQHVQVGLSASAGTLFPAYFDAFTWHFNSTMASDLDSILDDDIRGIKIRKFVM